MNFLRSAVIALILLTANSAMAKPHRGHYVPRSTHSDIFSFGSSSIVNTAASYLGMSERSNRGALQRVTHVDPARTPWCAAFVNGVLRQSGYRGTGSNAASSFTKYGRSTRTPQSGDIVVMNHHVGIFKGYSHGKIVVISGNHSNKVAVSLYSPSRVKSYRRVG